MTHELLINGHTPGNSILKDTIGRRNRNIPDKRCACCGKLFRPKQSKHITCSRDCGYKVRKLTPHNKGISKGWLNAAGYIEIRVNGKTIREHRHIMEVHIGRKLLPTEDVHHINGIKTDNNINNLELIDHAQHTSMHRSQRKNQSIKNR